MLNAQFGGDKSCMFSKLSGPQSYAHVGYGGKRSLPDDQDSLGYDWTRILEILDEMEAYFAALALVRDHDQDSRKRIICQLAEGLKDRQDRKQVRIAKLAAELRSLSLHLCVYINVQINNFLFNFSSGIYDKNSLDADQKHLRIAYDQLKAYYKAYHRGKTIGKCSEAYP